MTLVELLGRTPAADHPERRHALRLLRAHGLPAVEVVAVDVDSILYLTYGRRPRTAWLQSEGRAVTVLADEPGFTAEPG